MRKVKDLKTYYFECDCHTQEHTIGVAFDIDNKEVMMFVQLPQKKNFLQRLRSAFLYLFARPEVSGPWEELIMNEEKFMDFYNMMTRYTYTAGIINKSAHKIKKALHDHNNGHKNSAISSETHKTGDVLSKYTKQGK